MRSVRVAAKAVIVQAGRLLVTENVDGDGRWYLLPGGGQEPGEALPETLRRECREEVGVDEEDTGGRVRQRHGAGGARRPPHWH